MIPLFINAQEFDYLPAPVGNNQIQDYSQFTISYNEKHEQPDWVAYSLDSLEASSEGERCNCFRSDERIISRTASTNDYTSTGFDRGHLAPSADNLMSEGANAESFLMSNISPQLPALNRVLWADLEKWVRLKAKAHQVVYVVTGPIFEPNLGVIGNNEVTIPAYFYKVLLRFDGPNNTNPKTIGFILPNLAPIGEIKDYMVPVNAVETLTNLDFFPELPDHIENRAESQFEARTWNF